MSSIPCDIVLLPALGLAQRAIQISSSLAQHLPLFALSDSGPFPHVSLYMVQLRENDLEDVRQTLSMLATQTNIFNLKATEYYQEEGYIDPNYERTDSLARLQMTVVNAINPIRDGLRAKDQARLASATGVARENLEQYGYRSVGELFRPHMTLTRFADNKTIDTSGMPPVDALSGAFIELGLFEMGNNGTCVRKLASYPLQ